jgi:hypothetical protein
MQENKIPIPANISMAFRRFIACKDKRKFVNSPEYPIFHDAEGKIGINGNPHVSK